MSTYSEPKDETWKITPFRPNPKHLAEQFLRTHWVEYNDLITGDHAADLLAKWILLMTEWKQYWSIQEALNNIRRFELGCYKPKVSKLQHGFLCRKVPHNGTGYLHEEDQDGPYDVDGILYCGRCHAVYEEWTCT